ncbi:MAG: hypothetical protein ACPLZG_11020 [Thermoproteota archaeon]
MSEKTFETKLNVLLGRLLSRELGFEATSEYLSHRNRPDVIVYTRGIKVVIEGSYSKADAERDIERRVEGGLADVGIALFYKEGFSSHLNDSELENKLKNTTFEVKLVVPKDISETLLSYPIFQKTLPKWITGWIETKVDGLVTIINEATQFIISEEDIRKVVEDIEKNINEFVLEVKSVDRNKNIVRKLYDIFYKLYGLSVGNYEEIDELIYANAALTILLSSTFYQSIHAEKGLKSIDLFTKKYGYRLGLRKAFEEIQEKVDYERIYNVAIQVVEALPDSISSLKSIAELSEKISSKRTLLSRDFSGKVYHRIVGDWSIRKNFATFFTTIPASYLLAYLAVFTRTGVFREYSRTKVGDLACGSGTLLTAAYSALRDFYIYSKFSGGEEINLEEFHRQMLEEDIWGFDALRYAVQIASTNLALQNPTVGVSKMNTYAVPLGIEDGKVTMGSLEFLLGRAIPNVYFSEEKSFMRGAESASITENSKIPRSIPMFDFILMNPPFTRATGRGGRERGGLFGFIVDEVARKNVIDKFNELRNRVNQGLEIVGRRYYSQFQRFDERRQLLNIGQAGEGLLFLYLASTLVKDEGKIAFVLPKSLLVGTSWFLARCLLVDNFHLEHVVVSYDAENGYNFSESTSLSEVLIVARKRKNPEKDERSTITILIKKPLTSLEARALAFKVLRGEDGAYLKVNGAEAYTYKVSRELLVERLYNWGSLLAFPSPKLNEVASEVLSGSILGTNVPMVRLSEIATIGIDRHQFNDAFQKVERELSGTFPAVYGGEEERRLRMLTSPNARVLPKRIKTREGETQGERLFRNFSSKLLVPNRIWVDTTHAIALYSTEPILSNIFYSLRLNISEDLEKRSKALCLWLNTTWGILSVLANRSETRGRWIELSMAHWRLQPVLDVTSLSKEAIDKLAHIFDKYCSKDLRRLPEQFEPNNVDPVRRSMDTEFLEALNIRANQEDVEELYELLGFSLRTWLGEE